MIKQKPLKLFRNSIKNLHDLGGCLDTLDGSIPPYKRTYSGIISQTSRNAGLFKAYAEHLKNMIDNSNKSQDELLDILTNIFIFETDESTKKQIITLKKMSFDNLESLVVKTRSIIVAMYSQCEKDFDKGIQIFKAITELVGKNTALQRETNLKKLADVVENENDESLLEHFKDVKDKLNTTLLDYNEAKTILNNKITYDPVNSDKYY